ncbi:MAG: hypothetical protein ACSHX4_04890 [Opitutaceae bacterium]
MKLYPALILPFLIALCACSKPAEEKEPTSSDATSSSPEVASANLYEPVLIKVISGEDENAGYDQDRQAMGMLKRNIVELQNASKEETDPAKQAELFSEIEKAQAEYSDNAKKVKEAYGITLDDGNTYNNIPQKANVYLEMTADEIAKRKASDPEFEVDERVFALTKELSSPEQIQAFKQDVNTMRTMLNQAAQLQQQVDAEQDEARKAELSTLMETVKSQLTANNQTMFDTYGFSIDRNAQIRSTESNIYMYPRLPELNDVAGLAPNFVKVSTLEDADVNLEFSNNVQVMEGMRSDLANLQNAIVTELDADKKAELEKQFEELEAKGTENNSLMIKTYGFDLNRNYSRIIKQARLFVRLTPEEATKIKAEDPSAEISNDGLYKVVTINTVEANQQFQRNVQIMQNFRQQTMIASQTIEQEVDETKKAEAQQQLDQALEKLNENNTKMVELYGYSLERDYEYTIDISDLYLELSRKEISELEAGKSI